MYLYLGVLTISHLIAIDSHISQSFPVCFLCMFQAILCSKMCFIIHTLQIRKLKVRNVFEHTWGHLINKVGDLNFRLSDGTEFSSIYTIFIFNFIDVHMFLCCVCVQMCVKQEKWSMIGNVFVFYPFQKATY